MANLHTFQLYLEKLKAINKIMVNAPYSEIIDM